MLGINQADRNTQILIELVQGFMQHYDIEGIITTEVHSPIFMKEVERLVKERITKQKQKKESNFVNLFADMYVATYRIQHELNNIQQMINDRNDELNKLLDLYDKTMNLVAKK